MKKIIAITFLFSRVWLFSQAKIEISAHLYNGKIIIGTSDLKEINLQSDYGNFNIPIRKAKQVYFGLKTDASQKTKINTFLSELRSTSKSIRESAYGKIIEFGIKAIPVVSKYMDSNTEIVESEEYSVNNVYNELIQKSDIIDNLSEKDILEFDAGYKIQGNIILEKIDLKTEFGLQSISVSQISALEISIIESFGGLNGFTLIANKHISSEPEGWFKTGIKVKAGQKINISAKGTIRLASLSNAKYTPDGIVEKIAEVAEDQDPVAVDEPSDSAEEVLEAPIRLTPPIVVEEPYYSYPEYGQLVYKIGENGDALKAGSKFIGKIEKTGMLYLSIFESTMDRKNIGAFSAKIKVFK